MLSGPSGGNMTGKVTIDDVAAHAGVSIKTVSRVVNREANVRENTREKVQAAIDALKYRPNQAARGLAGRRSFLMGVLYDNPSPSYLANLQAGILAACSAASYGLALSPVSHNTPDVVETISAWIKHTNIDGVILTPPLSDNIQVVMAVKALGVPCVVVSSPGPGPGPAHVSAVVIDEEEAARQMTLHLVNAGHTKIAFIKGHPDHYASAHRFAGFKAAMQEAGLAVDGAMVKQGYFDFASGKDAGEALLGAANRPTAVFASNDDMAAGVMHVAHRLKLDIPAALAVVGFDDTPLSRQIWPSLTTIRQPIRLIGERAAGLLLAAIGGDRKLGEPTLQQLDFELKARGSSVAEPQAVAPAPAERKGPSLRRL